MTWGLDGSTQAQPLHPVRTGLWLEFPPYITSVTQIPYIIILQYSPEKKDLLILINLISYTKAL